MEKPILYRLLVSLADDERAALERIRIVKGLRSHAETLRALIRMADGTVIRAPRPLAVGAPLAGPRDALTGEAFTQRGAMPKKR